MFLSLAGRAAALALLANLTAACTVERAPTAAMERSATMALRNDKASWTTPVHLGDVVNSVPADVDPFTTRDGLSLYFSAGRGRGGSGGRDLWVARRPAADAPWNAPENLGTVINTDAHESKPTVTADGHWLWFVSDREGGHGDFDVYVAYRSNVADDFAWEAPVNAGTGVNSSASENSAVTFLRGTDGDDDDDSDSDDADSDGRGGIIMYFGSNRDGGVGGYDIYRATRGRGGDFGDAALVTALSSASDDIDPSIRRDGREMFLASNRPGGSGAHDLYVATRSRRGAPWSAPVNLGPSINTPPRDPALEQANDFRPSISWDGSTLYFASAFREGNVSIMFDLWQTTRTRERD